MVSYALSLALVWLLMLTVCIAWDKWDDHRREKTMEAYMKHWGVEWHDRR